MSTMELEYKYHVLNSLALDSVPNQVKKVHNFTRFFLKIRFNIVLPSS